MSTLALIGGLGWPEILVILAVILLLFGSAKIPQLMRGLGSGINEFKKGIKEGEQPEKTDEAKKDEPKKEEAPKP
jgi:sec-independent protein translocase protein TatA